MNKKTKKYFLGIGAILCIGLISYSLILFCTNKILSPVKIKMNSNLMEQRLYLRNLAEKIYSICLTIYTLGYILLIHNILINGYKIFITKLLSYFFWQIIFVLISVLPFALLDFSWFNDYIFPLRSLTILMLGLCIISYMILFFRNRIYK